MRRTMNSGSLGIVLLLLLSLAFSGAASAQATTAEEFYEEAVALLRTEQREEALEKLEASVKLDDTDPRPFALIGTIAFSLEDFGKAADAFRRAVELRPEDPNLRAGLCRALAEDGKVLEGIDECRKAVSIDADSYRANIDLIVALQLLSAPPYDLRLLIENALSRFPDNVEVLSVAARYYELRDSNRSVELYQRLASIEPENPGWHIALAELFIELERDRDAIDSANRVLALDPKNARAHYFVGRVYFELGQNADAAESLRRSVDLEPQSESTIYFLAIAEERRGRYSEAAAELRKLVSLDPDEFEYQLQLADVLLSDSRPQEALIPFQKAHLLQPDHLSTKTGLALTLTQLGRFAESIPLLESADRQDPGNEVVAQFLRVSRARQQGLAALDSLKRKAKEVQNDIGVRMQLFKLLGFAWRMDEAETYAEEIRGLEPNDPRVYVGLGTVYATVGDLQKAEEAYKRALEIREDAGAHLGLAGLYQRTDRPEEAVNSYEQVLRLNPESPNIMIGYGKYLIEIGKRREALAIFKRSLAQQPLNNVALLNAGFLSARFGELDAARGYLETLRGLGSPDARLLERWIRWRTVD